MPKTLPLIAPFALGLFVTSAAASAAPVIPLGPTARPSAAVAPIPAPAPPSSQAAGTTLRPAAPSEALSALELSPALDDTQVLAPFDLGSEDVLRAAVEATPEGAEGSADSSDAPALRALQDAPDTLTAPAPRLDDAPVSVATLETASSTARIDLNRADTSTLQTLPGIGAKKAAAIVAFRTEAPFRTVRQLAAVRGIGPRTLERIRPMVYVDSAAR